jgi:hypothetical protein
VSPSAASVARRGIVAGGGLAATLASHAIAEGPLNILPVAPLLWLTVVAVAVLSGLGPRAAAVFTAWSTPRILAVLVAAQIGFHLVLTKAPWALGVASHHSTGMHLDARALFVHVIAALVLMLVIRRGQRWVARAVTAVARLLAGAAFLPVARASYATPLLDLHVATSRCGWRGARSTRGPPAEPLPAT